MTDTLINSIPSEGTLPPYSSGWPQSHTERRDFFHRIRQFPPVVQTWRKSLIKKIRSGDSRFGTAFHEMAEPELRAEIDYQISYQREVARILAAVYGTPRLGNPTDPLDDLVYIVLSRKTRENAYQAGFKALKERFSNWDDLLASSREEVALLIQGGGLEDRKTDCLFGALEVIRAEFGSCTLEPAKDWDDERLATFLCSLPEISRKSAYCVMMYGFGRQVFPVDTHVGRVLSRLGPFREMGLSLSGKDHKQLQAILADLISPNLRYSLHVNLIAHGRAVCHPQRPDCDSCEIRKFCATYRQTAQETLKATSAPTMIDLFSGAGGMSEGFMRAGFRPVLVVDKYQEALRTYRFNHPGVPDERVLCTDIATLSISEIRQILGDDKVDVLIGSPPCQGFSTAGYRSKASATGYKLEDDDRNHLFQYMVNFALELGPRLFLMENVPGMESQAAKEEPFLHRAARLLEEGGYITRIWHLNAAAFGVPQERNRIFLVAARGVPLPQRPMGDYQDPSGNEVKDEDFAFWRDPLDRLPPRRLADAISDLPTRTPDSGTSLDPWVRKASEKLPAHHYLVQGSILGTSRFIFNHHARYQNERDLELYARLGQGENSVHAIEVHGMDGLMRYRRDVFDDKYAKLRADRPSKTIVAHLAKDGNGYIHPTQTRSLTPREAARIQSFPDDFVFCGSPSDQWIQIGNAVAPMLAEAIARTFLQTLTAKVRKGKVL